MSGQRNRGAGPLSKILKFTGLNTIVGLLGVALLAPIAIVGAVATGVGISVFDNLPPYIKPVTASQASTLYAVDEAGKPVEVARFYEENRISVSYDDISSNFRDAAIATEDPNFWNHNGVDTISLLRATLTNVATGGGGPGGSTITMQYVKNSLIQAATIAGDQDAIDAARSRGIDRKVREIRYSLALEETTSKEDIFAGYANLSFFGHQINGIEAASQFYYGKSAKDLSLAEGAMLAAMLKAPEAYRPDAAENLDRAKGRRDYVIQNMVEKGYISQSEADAAKATPVTVNVTKVPTGCESNQQTAFFCDYVIWTIRNSPEFGPTLADRELKLKTGGMDIYTTMNLKLQAAADTATKKWVPVKDPSGIGSASVSIEAGTGRVLAMAQNRIFDQTHSEEPGHTSVNYSTDKAYGGSSGFQVGSTYKLFTLAQWLTSGFKLNDHIDGRVREWNASDFTARCGSLVGTWAPKNIVKEPEDTTVVHATAISENTAFAYMASKLDLCDIRDTALRFGVHRADGTELQYVPSSIIGVNEIAPISMAAAVAAISNQGIYCAPLAIDKVVLRETKEQLTVPQPNCTPAVSPEVAAGMTYAMRAVMSGGTGGASNTGDGAQLAGKTGTTDSGVHTWMTGFSSKVGTATWVGNVSGSTSLSKIKLNKKAGNTVRHDIWRSIMKVANTIYTPGPLANPPQSMIDATMVPVPDIVGQLPSAGKQQIDASSLNSAIIVEPILSDKPAGQVAATVPRPGSVVPSGTTVKIYVSKGGKVRIPSAGVVGESKATAKATLLALGFAAVSEPQPSQTQYFQHSATIPAGYVIGTTPKVGTLAGTSTAILLIISSGP
jgi:membrane peptidoglycan carboxypeptidase